MADNDFPSISRGDFERAFEVYLRNLQEAMENKEWGIWSWAKGAIPWADSPKEFTDKLFDETMDVVDVQGVGPWVPHFEDIVGARIQRWDRNQAIQEAQKAAEASSALKLKLAEFKWKQAAAEESARLAREKFAFTKQQAQKDFASGQAEWGQKLQQAQMEANVFQKGMETAQIQRSLAGMGRRNTFAGGVATAQQEERDFERIRQNTLSGLTGDRNWLAREQEKSIPNPWTGAQLSPQENIADLKSLETYLKGAIQRSDTRIKSLVDPEGPGSEDLELNRQTLRDTLSNVEEQITGVEFNVLSPGARQIASDIGLGSPEGSQIGAYQTAIRFSGNPESGEFANLTGTERAGLGNIVAGEGLLPMSPAEPTGVEVPKWLPRFVPGLTGKFIPGTGQIPGRAPKITPFSPQQWRATPLRTREQLSGYAQFVGQDIGELERRMWQRQPQGLRLGRTFRSAVQRT